MASVLSSKPAGSNVPSYESVRFTAPEKVPLKETSHTCAGLPGVGNVKLANSPAAMRTASSVSVALENPAKHEPSVVTVSN